jgi:hypothetical protein
MVSVRKTKSEAKSWVKKTQTNGQMFLLFIYLLSFVFLTEIHFIGRKKKTNKCWIMH